MSGILLFLVERSLSTYSNSGIDDCMFLVEAERPSTLSAIFNASLLLIDCVNDLSSEELLVGDRGSSMLEQLDRSMPKMAIVVNFSFIKTILEIFG